MPIHVISKELLQHRLTTWGPTIPIVVHQLYLLIGMILQAGVNKGEQKDCWKKRVGWSWYEESSGK